MPTKSASTTRAALVRNERSGSKATSGMKKPVRALAVLCYLPFSSRILLIPYLAE
jgi:hypothetical protein